MIFRLFRSRAEDDSTPIPQDYRVYTTKFDLEIPASRIDDEIGTADKPAWQELVEQYERSVDQWGAAANLAAVEILGRFKAEVDQDRLEDTVACLLVDHSGSLRGQNAILACATIEIVADYWSRLGIKFEILGFTTRSWMGGRPRMAWQFAGRRKYPGRLCELLHIIYRSADATHPGAPRSIRNILRSALLKENIDGEAVLWARDRLAARPESNKVIVVVSDGAPVDDSTISANFPHFLWNHVTKVIADVAATPGFGIAGIGIGYDVSGFYSRHMKVESTHDIDAAFIRFAGDVLVDTKS